ncbi:ImmA/IrrE family metallo-endopeptidase [Prescottella equi]|uniref:ImmA/IrrE family metallo-endopeptidase n=1 Tax=Rhodococcus hoagii TaxID=43767 RepID=UPI000A1121FB|nr:ImmA/IrrE family metallo-endopeptidase [Prescottella equi]
MFYNPWHDARDNFPEYLINIRHELPPGVAGGVKGRTIYLCRTLTQEARRCVLCHELVHLRRGTTHVHGNYKTREEFEVDRIAARLLITPDQFVDALLWTRRHHHECAAELGVDRHTFKVWVQTLNKNERDYITRQLRQRGEP